MAWNALWRADAHLRPFRRCFISVVTVVLILPKRILISKRIRELVFSPILEPPKHPQAPTRDSNCRGLENSSGDSMPDGTNDRRTQPFRRRRRRAGQLVFAAAALALLATSRPLLSDEGLSKEARINLIRGLDSEIAVTKITLPRGKHGVILDSKGELEKAQAEKEMRNNGPAILPGMPVEITKLTFKSNKIIFEINGGGKHGKKWYQHIEIGVGNQTTPIAQTPPVLTYGSWITLTLPGKISNLTVAEAKHLLSAALDFTRHSPTVLYSRTTPPKFKEAIEKHQVLVGMDRDTVLSSKGPPDRKVHEDHPDGTEEDDWIYGLPPHVLYVVFEDDIVTRVHQY